MPESHSVVLPIPASPCNTTAPGRSVTSSAAAIVATSPERPMTCAGVTFARGMGPLRLGVFAFAAGLAADLTLGPAALPPGRPTLRFPGGEAADRAGQQHHTPGPGHPARPEVVEFAGEQAADAPDAGADDDGVEPA